MSAVPVRRSQRVNALLKQTPIVNNEVEMVAESPPKMDKPRSETVEENREILVQVETEPNEDRRVASESEVKRTQDEKSHESSLSGQNQQHGDSNGSDMTVGPKIGGNQRTCVVVCDANKEQATDGSHKLAVAHSYDRSYVSNTCISQFDNKFFDGSGSIMNSCASATDVSRNPRLVSRARYSYANDQYMPPVDANQTPIISHDRELYNGMVGPYYSDASVNNQTMAKHQSCVSNDGTGVAPSDMSNSVRAASTHRASIASGAPPQFGEAPQYGVNMTTENVGGISNEYHGANLIGQIMDRRRNSLYDQFLDRSRYY